MGKIPGHIFLGFEIKLISTEPQAFGHLDRFTGLNAQQHIVRLHITGIQEILRWI